ncbi:prepilin-type N-terminal cleavage/methylation domain-containing protein [Acinetobacter brisouii]
MKKNNGFTLLEVLISLLLLMIIGLGGAYLLARANVTQRDMNIHLLTVSKMRNALQNGTCSSSSQSSLSLPINSNTTKTVTCTSTSAQYTVTPTTTTSSTSLSAADVTVTSQRIAEPSSASNPITISP